MEDAILSAIAAMNEPKTCSTTALKKYILENHPGTNSNFQGKLYNFPFSQVEREFCSCRCVCAAPLNYLVELARELTAAPLFVLQGCSEFLIPISSFQA